MNPEIKLQKVSLWSVISMVLGIFGLTFFIAFSKESSLYLEATVISAALAVIVGLISLIIFRKKQSSLSKVFSILGILFGFPTILFVATVAQFIFDLSSGI
ncbi:MAG: hypothetical protein WCV79_03400 [Candidatus Paceibacterota bacterium]|jgi:hypothetical protein